MGLSVLQKEFLSSFHHLIPFYFFFFPFSPLCGKIPWRNSLPALSYLMVTDDSWVEFTGYYSVLVLGCFLLACNSHFILRFQPPLLFISTPPHIVLLSLCAALLGLHCHFLFPFLYSDVLGFSRFSFSSNFFSLNSRYFYQFSVLRYQL